MLSPQTDAMSSPMSSHDLCTDLLDAWRVHNQILLFLLANIPAKGFSAVPAGSKGRDVKAQFAHLQSVRTGWLQYHRTGIRLTGKRYDKTHPPSRAQLKKALTRSGKEIEQFLGEAFKGNAHVRMFGKNPVRWMGYLISHESHHRGQIMLAVKQSGAKLPESVALNGLWGKWIFGK